MPNKAAAEPISRQLAYQRRHKVRSLCTLCPNPREPGFKLCTKCRAKNKDRNSRRYYARKGNRNELRKS